MTIQEAFNKAKNLSDKKILDRCLDLGDGWAFRFRHNLLSEDPVLIGGIHWYAVHKITGEVMSLSSTPRDQTFLSAATLVHADQLGCCISGVESIFYRIFNK